MSLSLFLHAYPLEEVNFYCFNSLYRFSPFVKTGTESFVLGAAAVKSGIPDQFKVPIIVSPEGIV